MFRKICHSLALATLMLTLSSLAQAQATRTFVSGVGNDADPCSRTAPCRTWSGALIKTFINGEINALDPGGYGTLNITKSITIDGHETKASTLSSGTNGFIINVPTGVANDPHRSVRLRNISINGTGPSGTVGTRTGLDAIRILQAADVAIEHVFIQDFSGDGVEVNTGANVDVMMNDVIIRNCNGSGIKSAASAGQVVGQLDNVRIQNCAVGFESRNRGRFGIRNSVITHNTTGVRTAGVDNIINIDDLFVSFATDGVIANVGGTIRLSNTVVTQNVNGINANGGEIVSMDHNSIFGNTNNGVFSSTQPKL
jgi:hypothetical protein